MNCKVINNFAATIALLLAAGNAVAAPVELRLRNEVRLDRPVVRLGDVAEIVAADAGRAQQLANMILMPAPAPATQRFLSKQEIQDLLAAHGEGPGAIRLSGRDRVVVISPGSDCVEPAMHYETGPHASRRTTRPTSHAGSASTASDDRQMARLREKIDRAIRDYLDARSGQAGEWQISFDVPERQLRQIETAQSAPFCRGGNPPWTGRQRFIVSLVTVEGELHVPIYADVTRPQPVVVATRTIARGATITAADLDVRHVEHEGGRVSFPTGNFDSAAAIAGRKRNPNPPERRVPFASLEELVGLVASRTIQPGEIIYADHVQPPLLVKRGELITVSTEGGGIRVRTTARARQDGVRGDLIQVESLETKGRYDARVVGPGEAAVLATSARGVARAQADGPPTNRR